MLRFPCSSPSVPFLPAEVTPHFPLLHQGKPRKCITLFVFPTRGFSKRFIQVSRCQPPGASQLSDQHSYLLTPFGRWAMKEEIIFFPFLPFSVSPLSRVFFSVSVWAGFTGSKLLSFRYLLDGDLAVSLNSRGGSAFWYVPVFFPGFFLVWDALAPPPSPPPPLETTGFYSSSSSVNLKLIQGNYFGLLFSPLILLNFILRRSLCE